MAAAATAAEEAPRGRSDTPLLLLSSALESPPPPTAPPPRWAKLTLFRTTPAYVLGGGDKFEDILLPPSLLFPSLLMLRLRLLLLPLGWPAAPPPTPPPGRRCTKIPCTNTAASQLKHSKHRYTNEWRRTCNSSGPTPGPAAAAAPSIEW